MANSQKAESDYGDMNNLSNNMSKVYIGVNNHYDDDFVGNYDKQRIQDFGIYSSDSDKEIENVLSGVSVNFSNESPSACQQEDVKTPIKRPYLKKGEGKSLVISNSRKSLKKTEENNSILFKGEKKVQKVPNYSLSSFESTGSMLTTENNGLETNYDELIQKKLDLIDEKIEYIHETQEDIIKKKAIIFNEKKRLENFKIAFEKELKAKYEKRFFKLEEEVKKLRQENNKLEKEKVNSNDLITRLKMAIKNKDAEISRLKDINREKKENERKVDKNKIRGAYNESKGNSESEFNFFVSSSTYSKPTSNRSMVSNEIASANKDIIIEEFISKFNFEKELDSLYGILSTSFSLLTESFEFTSLPKIPSDLNKPWCDIEKPYRINKDDISKTITFKFPSGLVEVVFFDDSDNSICPVNTRKLLWTHLGWCILVYPNNDIKAIKPDKDIIYHYVNKGIVRCVVNINSFLNNDFESSKLHISKFFSIGQLQCFDPDTKKTYIVHSDNTLQILNNSCV
ncbi:hypothetical protein FG386_001859 [Cryptosporidium ryanae]|uniref:uncharacterized protein n=1 Tax=Cryptosporidium ryanae TaxID=515981 RepID=UPI00351A9CFF|nr:hypothetical protein FG386_001859 [Cryptosporidium ryanae]